MPSFARSSSYEKPGTTARLDVHRLGWLIYVLGHVLELILRPVCDGMDVAILVAHEFQIVSATLTGFAPIPRKPPTSMIAVPPAPEP